MLFGFRSEPERPNRYPADTPLNVIVLGDTLVGKSSLLEYYCSPTNDQDENIQRTIGLDIHVKRLVRSNRTYTVNFFDFGGDLEHQIGQTAFIKAILLKAADQN